MLSFTSKLSVTLLLGHLLGHLSGQRDPIKIQLHSRIKRTASPVNTEKAAIQDLILFLSRCSYSLLNLILFLKKFNSFVIFNFLSISHQKCNILHLPSSLRLTTLTSFCRLSVNSITLYESSPFQNVLSVLIKF